MTSSEKATTAFAAGVAALIIWVLGAYWWSNTAPGRPKGAPSNSVFLSAPHVGLPAPRRGWWLACTNQAQHNRCEISDIDGNLEYEGEFIPYERKEAIPADQLTIDTVKTGEHKVWVGKALVPLVYLRNGEVLIPANKYEEGAQLLRESKVGR
jgi:hypothetical protein